MRILLETAPSAHHFIREGWANVFRYCGHQVFYYDVTKKSAFDVFYEVNPDVFLGMTYNITDSLYKNIANRPNLKVGLYCSAWGEFIKQIDLKEYPIDVVKDDEKAKVARLYKECQKPDIVFLHLADNCIDKVIGNWKETGTKPVGIMNAADILQYYTGMKRDKYVSDINYIGGRWVYKSRNIDKYLLPLCNSDLSIKIWGNTQWPVAQYLGLAPENDSKDIFASAVICPNISESHSTTYGYDVVERPFKILAAGGTLASDNVQSLNEEFENNIPTFSSADELYHIVQMAKKVDKYKLALDTAMEKSRTILYAKHTYFHRVSKMLYEMNLSEESKNVLSCYENWRKANGIN